MNVTKGAMSSRASVQQSVTCRSVKDSKPAKRRPKISFPLHATDVSLERNLERACLKRVQELVRKPAHDWQADCNSFAGEAGALPWYNSGLL